MPSAPLTDTAPAPDRHQEFDRQVDTLIDRGYPAVAGLSTSAFRRLAEPLRTGLDGIASAAGDGYVPFVLVVDERTVGLRDEALAMRMSAGSGITDMTDADLRRFRPIEGLTVPDAGLYLLVDVDTGAEYLNVTPDLALPGITGRGRSPLTVAEGIAVVTHLPGILRERNCFSLLGSRCGDRRVTAVWVSKKRPKLGWCWAGNPHTWLGSASCGGRLTGSPGAVQRLAG
jgi:hypothetical protein